MTLFEYLNLRSQWEDIVKDFKLPIYSGTTYGLNWFLKNGHGSNSLRPGYDRAREIAQHIIDNV